MTNDSERPGANFAGRNSRIVTASAWTLLGINFYRAAETWLTQPSSKQRKRITTKMLFLRNKENNGRGAAAFVACAGFGVCFGRGAISLFAVDGVVLIDQTHALAGDLTPGERQAFP
jgi:hypothetical protein